MPFLFVVLYGLLSGFFDVLPVSSFAHQSVLRNIFGVDDSLHLYNFLIHLASLGALIFASLPSINGLLREQRFLALPRKKAQAERKFTYELRFLKTATVAAALSTVVLLLVGEVSSSLLLIGVFCIVNGILILVPEYLPFGNKTAKHMNRLDSIFLGLLGSLGVLPGISHIATMQCYANLRGVDRTRSCNWVHLSTIPVLTVLVFFDLIGIFTAGIGVLSFLTVLSFIAGAIFCFLGTFGGVTLMRFLSAKGGFVGFGYYSIGGGLLTFFLYLTV